MATQWVSLATLRTGYGVIRSTETPNGSAAGEDAGASKGRGSDMITHYIQVERIRRRLEQLRQEADVLARRGAVVPAELLRGVIAEFEADLVVPLDTRITQQEALAGTGLSARSLSRRPREGEGTQANYMIRDLMAIVTDDADSEPARVPETTPAPNSVPAQSDMQAAIEAALRAA